MVQVVKNVLSLPLKRVDGVSILICKEIAWRVSSRLRAVTPCPNISVSFCLLLAYDGCC